MSGLLAIWNDCASGREEEYEGWYQEEHFPERLAVAGFSVGRRFQAVDARLRFLTTYEVDAPAVLTSATYLERLANPTPRTSMIMGEVFKNMSRTVCVRENTFGRCRGPVVVTAVATDANGLEDIRSIFRRSTESPSLTHGELWIAADTNANRSKEEKIRGEDVKIFGCLTLEYLREERAREAAWRLRGEAQSIEVGVYRLLCQLNAEGVK